MLLWPAMAWGDSALQESVIKKQYPSGELMSEYVYYKGQLNGLSKDYYKNGQPMYEWSYRADKLHGPSKAYYMDGKIKSIWNYKKGQLEGSSKQFFNNGRVKSVDTYKAGKLVRQKVYNEDGKLILKSFNPPQETPKPSAATSPVAP
jgi:antitoxin component YwqK of YwqJK toxin-antitoxin module